MAQPGDVLENSAGDRMVFRKTNGSTHGLLLDMEVTYHAQSPPPAPHYHPMQEEQFEIISGSMQVQLGETTHVYHAGDTFIVPVGVSHSMHNPTNEEAVVIWQVYPALNTEAMFETIWGLAADGKTDAGGKPPLLQAAVIGYAYRNEYRQTKPPYTIMRFVLPILALMGWLMGYRPRYNPTKDRAYNPLTAGR